jgi:hypothetical protein
LNAASVTIQTYEKYIEKQRGEERRAHKELDDRREDIPRIGRSDEVPRSGRAQGKK